MPHSAVRGLGLGPGEPGPPWGTQNQEIHGCAAKNQVCSGGARLLGVSGRFDARGDPESGSLGEAGSSPEELGPAI